MTWEAQEGESCAVSGCLRRLRESVGVVDFLKQVQINENDRVVGGQTTIVLRCNGQGVDAGFFPLDCYNPPPQELDGPSNRWAKFIWTIEKGVEVMSDNHLSRRRFLRNLAVAAPASGLIMVGPASAQDLPKLALTDPLAVGLQYVEDATTSSAPNYKAGQDCDNCLQIQGNEGDAFRPCAIVPGKSVSAKGWCSVWVAKP